MKRRRLGEHLAPRHQIGVAILERPADRERGGAQGFERRLMRRARGERQPQRLVFAEEQ